MDVHLITTDKSCFQLIETIGEALNKVGGFTARADQTKLIINIYLLDDKKEIHRKSCSKFKS